MDSECLTFRNEAAFSRAVLKNIKSKIKYRIETGKTLLGFPDIMYARKGHMAYIEMKYVRSDYNFSNLVHIAFRPQQPIRIAEIITYTDSDVFVCQGYWNAILLIKANKKVFTRDCNLNNYAYKLCQTIEEAGAALSGSEAIK